MFWCDSHRDVIEVDGRDAATYLQSQLSNDVAGLAVDASTWSFVLEPNGRVDALVRVWRRSATSFILDTDAGFGEVVTYRLRRFLIRVDVAFTEIEQRVVAVRGTDERPAGAVVAWGDGYDIVGDGLAVPPGTRQGTAADLETARIEAGWPAMGAEIVPGETIPAETGIVSVAVSFTKGCYPGQELVERMNARSATAPRSLVVVDVGPGAAPGDQWVVDGVPVGILTSVAGARALAVIRRGRRT